MTSLCPDEVASGAILESTGIPVLSGTHIDDMSEIPRSFEHLEGSTPGNAGLRLENGRLRIVAIAYPIHHVQVGVLLLAFRWQESRLQFLARSGTITDVAGGVMDDIMVVIPPTLVADGSLSFRIAMRDPVDNVFEYDVTWNGEAKTLTAERAN